MGAVALSAMALGMIGIDGAMAKPKSAVIKSNPPAAAAEVETGQLLIKDRPVAKSGTKPVDANASANELCGLPYTAPCVTDAPAVDVETGQLLDKGPRWPHNQKVEAAGDDPCKRAGAQCDPRDGVASSARNKSDTIKPDSPSAAEPKGKGPKGDASSGYATPMR